MYNVKEIAEALGIESWRIKGAIERGTIKLRDDFSPSYLIFIRTLGKIEGGTAVFLGEKIEIMGLGLTYSYFPTTGARGDIGPLPRWTTRYLLSQDLRAKTSTLGTADLAGSFDSHYRDKTTGLPITIIDNPAKILTKKRMIDISIETIQFLINNNQPFFKAVLTFSFLITTKIIAYLIKKEIIIAIGTKIIKDDKKKTNWVTSFDCFKYNQAKGALKINITA